MDDDKSKDDILRRLKSVEGHVRGIQRMVQEGHYCIDVINQAVAVQSALDRINGLVLERHLKTCVTTAIKSEDRAERERVIGELLQVFQGHAGLARRSLRGEDLGPAAEPDGGCRACGDGAGRRSVPTGDDDTAPRNDG